MYCPNCKKDVSTTISKHIDCVDCCGTGIGYPPPEAKCGICKGRGYLIIKSHHTELYGIYICDECDEAVEGE